MEMSNKMPITIRDVTYDATGKEVRFDNLLQLYRFLEQEEDFWERQGKRLETEGKDRHSYFECVTGLRKIREVIDSWGEQLPSWDKERFTQEVENLKQNYDAFLRERWLCARHSYTAAFIECNREYGVQAAAAFIGYVANDKVSLRTKAQFLGAMQAYEYFHQDFHIERRREEEKRFLEDLREQTSKTLSEFQEKIKFNEKRGERQNLEQRSTFENQLDSWKETIKDLEQLYEEKLRLRKPAEYWNKAAKKYKGQGAFMFILLFTMILLGLWYLSDFFSSWLQGEKIPIGLETLQGVVLFGSIITIYGFFIRVLSRLTFSAFHLMRDAEEREQLTYLYLSLSESEPSEKESREIILQSLFSRSQTGLLQNENGPSMPMDFGRTQRPEQDLVKP